MTMGQVRPTRPAPLSKARCGRLTGSFFVQDMSLLYPEVLACLSIEVLEIKKMVYLFLINYSRSRPDMVDHALPNLLSVSFQIASPTLGTPFPSAKTTCLLDQDINDHNALIRALALRTMSAIPVAEVHRQLVEPLRHALKDQDPYVRKTAAIAVAKVYMHDRRLIERTDMITRLRDLLMDPNPTVIANAVAALTEISERSDNIHLRFNSDVARRLVRAMSEASECVSRNHLPKPPLPKSG